MPFGSLSNVLEIKSAEGFRGSSVLQQSYPLTGYRTGAAAPAAFTPLSLFTGGVQGVWYDPSDLTTMFEDATGLIPVHTPGNGTADSPVGKLLDKSGNANHATQLTVTARPTLSAKYNLLTYSQDFTNGVWTKGGGSSISANSTTAPDGTSTASTLTQTTSSNDALYQNISASQANVTYTASVSLKKNTHRYGYVILCTSATVRYSVLIDLQTGLFVDSKTQNTPTNTSYSITDQGNGWYRLSLTAQGTAGSGYIVIECTDTIPITITGSLDISNRATTGSIYIWGADFRATNDGVGLPAYQRVVDANTYDSTGFPYYLKSDGVDDYLSAAASWLNGVSGFDSFTSFRSLATKGAVFSWGVLNGLNYSNDILCAIDTLTSSTSKPFYEVDNGAGGGMADSSARSIPSTYVDTFRFDGSQSGTARLSKRTNASSVTTTFDYTPPASTATRTSPLLFLGVYGDSPGGWYFNHRQYGLIIRIAISSATEVSNTETWLNGKTKAY